MSSYYVTVSRAEWEKMRTCIANSDAYIVRSAKEIELLNALERKNRDRLAQIQNRNNHVIQNAVDAFVASISSSIDQFSGNMSDAVRADTAQAESELAQLRRAASQSSFRLAQVASQVENLSQTYARSITAYINSLGGERARATAALDELSTRIQELQQLSPERFFPSEVKQIQATQQLLTANINSEDWEAAIATAQNGIVDVGRLIVRTILAGEALERQLRELRRTAAAFSQRMEYLAAKEGVVAVSIDGNDYDIPYDINHWTQGQFSDIREQYRRLEAILLSDTATQEDYEWASRELENLALRLDYCDALGRAELGRAVSAQQLAANLNDSLSDSGWDLQSSGYENEDNRNPFNMTYRDGSGNTVSIVVSGGDNPDQPSFFCEAFSASRAMESIIKEGIAARLNAHGISVESSTERNDCANNPNATTFIENMNNEARVMQRRRLRRGLTE